ncbi:ribosome silencing factor [Pseudorhodoferax soli]|uniref:Ribosomal silencing factor RsfS n=1 Tax=Pseudorhodoferax soli TaxID=545864 RepID=A0A368XTC2_9BURK|nr:ribosome silencing factor [Pseudorhodoferax soli]RCW70298.1 ribosome-associated protein [Pseudorhodoferax soli]
MTTGTSTESAAKKDTQKLQRSIIDGLEDVKAQDIQVFNTEHLSPLFERVIVASGTSNRQTRALAASVRDAVREAGFSKPRIEGEDNGEWIIVDCGPAVVHIMQPSIRQYYHLEELWGDKPVRLKLGAPKPAAPVKAVEKAPAKKVAAKTAAGKTPAGRKAAAKKARKPEPEYAPERPVIEVPARKKAPAKKAAPAAKTAAPAAPARKAPLKATSKPKTLVVGKPAPAKKAAAAKKAAPAKKAPQRRA